MRNRHIALLLLLSLSLLILPACGGGGSAPGGDPPPEQFPEQSAPAPEQGPEQSPAPSEEPPVPSEPAGEPAPSEEPTRLHPTQRPQVTQMPSQPPEVDQTTVYEDWAQLVGYWNDAEGRYFLLDMQDSHSAYLETGIWGTGYERAAYITQLELIDPNIHRGTAHFYATEGTEMDDPLPAEETVLIVDWINWFNDGSLKIELAGETYYCFYAGQFREEAADAYLGG